MELHKLQKASGSRKKPKRVGRGNAAGSGTTAGRGTKGLKARSGGKTRRGFEGGQMPLYRRIPKRGFRNFNRKEYAIVNVKDLEKSFEAGAEISPQDLRDKKIVRKFLCGVKILGTGELSKAFTVKAHRFTKTAVEKIQNAGGTVEELK